MHDLWPWVVAIDAYDHCDSEPLLKLIAKEQKIPKEFAQAIADIISGKRKPNKRAASKLKIPARERMEIAAGISIILGLIDVFKHTAVYPEGVGVIGIAARDCREPIDVKRELEGEARELMQYCCKDLNVSQETLENLLRDMRKKINMWPVV